MVAKLQNNDALVLMEEAVLLSQLIEARILKKTMNALKLRFL